MKKLYIFITFMVIIFVSIICLLLRKPRQENFEVASYNINAACLYAAHNIEQVDVDFIMKYAEQIPFYVVNNGELTEAGKQLKNSDIIKLLVRDNKGYDAGAWKEGIKEWENELKQFDLVLFINNSCIYGIDLYRFCEHAIDFDLYSHGFTWTRGQKPHPDPHFNTYMYSFHKRLFNSQDFRDYWDAIDSNNGGHDEAVHNNEYVIQKYFKERGYKLGNYITMDTIELYDFHPTRNYSPELIKKGELRERPRRLMTFYFELENNRRKGY